MGTLNFATQAKFLGERWNFWHPDDWALKGCAPNKNMLNCALFFVHDFKCNFIVHAEYNLSTLYCAPIKGCRYPQKVKYSNVHLS